MEFELARNNKGEYSVICQTNSVEDTKVLGSALGKFLQSYKGSLCIALVGDLGTGKTHLAQGVAQGFGFEGNVASPTFALMNTYEVKRNVLYHFDLYRLDSPEELENIGFSEYTDRTKSLIEWANKFETMMPENIIWIFIDEVDYHTRRFEFISPTITQDTLESIGGRYVLRN